MSKNIVIQEGGNGKQFTASKLNTALVGGGSCNWVPEDEVGLTTLNVSENGTYMASSEGHYGYSQVNVNVAGGAGGSPGGAGSSIIGKDTDGDTVVSTVEEDGTIKTEKQVDRIRIGIPPTKTAYVDGETIDVTGMTVMGLTTTGTYLKFIPLSEITISPTEADISQVTAEEYTDGAGINALMVDCSEEVQWIFELYGQQHIEPEGYTDTRGLGSSGTYSKLSMQKWQPGKTLITKYNGLNYVANVEGSDEINLIAYLGVDEGWLVTSYTTARAPFGQFSTSSHYNDEWNGSNIPVSTVDPRGKSVSGMQPVGGTQTITVSWTRPSDGAVLTTSFEITVTEEAQSSGSGGSGGGIPIEDNPHDNPTLYYEDVAEAINLATLSGDSTVYFRGETYTMAEAIKLRDSLPHSPTA